MDPARRMLRGPLAGSEAWLWGLLAASLLAFVVSLVLALGARTTSGPVATVGGRPISLPTYEHWLAAVASEAHATEAAYPPFPPDTPSYSRRCAAFLGQAVSKSATFANSFPAPSVGLTSM